MQALKFSSDDISIKNNWHVFLLRQLKMKKSHLRYIESCSKNSYGAKHDLLRAFISKHYNLKIGKYSYGFLQLCNKDFLVREIGAFCSIASGVKIAMGYHPTSNVTTHPFLYDKSFGWVSNGLSREQADPRNLPISIGHDVWIGMGAILLPGIRIGTGSIIGAGAVVTKDVPPYAIVAGVPARIINYRFDPDTISLLLNTEWWTWSDDKIKSHLSLMKNPESFLGKDHGI